MYPNDQPPQYSVDYLNQIAAPGPKQGFFDKKAKIVLLIVGVLMLLSIPLIIMGILNSTDQVTADQVAIKVKSLELASKEVHEDIGDSELRSLNSSLSIVLANTAREIAPYSANARDLTAIVEADPEAIELQQKLEDATLNAVINRTYPREMAYQLEVVMLDLQRLYDESENSDFKALVSQTYDQLEPIQKQFEEFSAASS